MAAGGGSSILRLRLYFMTAIYLPILLYAMSTYELERGSLVISERNLEAVVVPSQDGLFAGDIFEASVLYRPVGTDAASASLVSPDIIIDRRRSPEGLHFDQTSRKFVFDTQSIFDGEPDNIFDKQVSFAGTAVIRSIVDNEIIRKPFEQTFTVRRPNVNVISNAPPRLVSNSQNDLSFLVSGLNDDEIVLRESSRNLTVNGPIITWNPTGESTTVSIFRRLDSGEESLIDRRQFRVVPPPPPRVIIRRARAASALTSNDVISITDDQIELVIQPDPTFMQDYPDDANYRIGNITLSYYQPGRPPQTIQIPASSLPFDRQRSAATGHFIYGPFRLSQLNNQIRGNEVRIEIQSIDRINYRNASERVSNELFQDFFSLRTR